MIIISAHLQRHLAVQPFASSSSLHLAVVWPDLLDAQL